MPKNKIADNPSFQELTTSIEALEAFSKAYHNSPLAKQAFPNLEETFKGFESLKLESDNIIHTPDIFNQKFAHLGWISREKLDENTMRGAIELCYLNDIETAEAFLSDYYDEDKLTFEIKQFKLNRVLEKRLKLINLAKLDYLEERYHACIPLLLSLMDGIVNDISKHVGFFAQQSDMVVIDSIVGHETGIAFLASLMSKGRNKTTTEEITIPYRNGILHGRDLNFDNKLVAAKVWATLFSIKDWALEYQNKDSRKKEPEKNKPLLEAIHDYNQTKEYKKKIDEWKPRSQDSFNHIPMVNEFQHAPLNTPEKVVAEFFENWKNKRYGLMVNSLLFLTEKPQSKRAGEIRNNFSHLQPKFYNISLVKDTTSAISIVHIEIDFEMELSKNNKIFPIRVGYYDKDNNILARFESDGEWKIIQISLMDILNKKFD